MNIMNIENITKSLGTRALLNTGTARGVSSSLFDEVSLGINAGDKIGFIGVNGTGKSTFLKIVAGVEEPDGGKVTKGNGVTVSYLAQNPEYDSDDRVLDYVVRGKTTDTDALTVESEAKRLLNRLDVGNFDALMGNLSGGQSKRVALARTLLFPARVLVLDEPTNHLDSDMVNWLEDYLVKFKGEIIMVTHDRYFLDKVTNKIVELDKGKLYEYKTNYRGFLELKTQREESELSTYKKHQNILRKELAWAMRGCQARSTKQQARLERVEALKKEKAPELAGNVVMESVASRLGKKTIEVKNISKAYDGVSVVRDYSYIFLRDDRIGIVGKNGCGKSTLVKMITGEILPDSGSVEIGDTVRIGYFMQENEPMDLSLRVIDYIRNIAEFIETSEGKISASRMLERFLFTPDMQYTIIGKLSGGERRRLYLLSVLMSAPNVLVLDEPTNDLDISTLTILEDYLDTFAGIIITVSHDRYFLDRVVRRIFAFENGNIVQYEGGYTDYEAKRDERIAAAEGVSSIYIRNDSGEGTKDKSVKPRVAKLKFTYMEQKEFETIDDDIEKLEKQVALIDKKIMDNATDSGRLNELMKEKEETEEKLSQKMERWEYLNELYEKIQNQN